MEQQETVVGADGEEELLKSDGVLEFQGLTVKERSGLLVDGLADAQDGWSEMCDVLVVGLVDSLHKNLSAARRVLLLFFVETTSNYLQACVALDEESERVGIFFEKELVDHDTDLNCKLHERKGSISARLRFGLRFNDAWLALGLDVLLTTTSTTVRSFDSKLCLPDGGQRG